MKKINIALCGTGNVGSSFIDLVLKNKQKIMSNFDIDINYHFAYFDLKTDCAKKSLR